MKKKTSETQPKIRMGANGVPTIFNSPYNYTRGVSALYATVNNEESLTQQGDAAECDINVIVKRFSGQGGLLPNVTQQPMFGDFTEVGDYRSMVEKVNQANELFASVPAEIRRRFGNDPQEFINFCANKDNLDELRKMGLANKLPDPPKPPEPMPVRIIQDPDEAKK